jgi:SulP family sulfate permease
MSALRAPAVNLLRWAPDLAAGLIASMVVLALSGSYALLIFSGPLAPYAGLGIYVSLISAVVIGLAMLVFGGHPALLSIPQDRIAPILGFLSAALAAILPSDGSPSPLLATVLTVVALASLSTGLVLWLLGTLKLGNFVRFIPYPVIGGFLAGSGWLLVTGSIKAVTGVSFTFENLASLVAGGAIAPWLPAALFGGALFFAQEHVRHWAVLPSFLVGGLVVFYGWLTMGGHGIADARESGWLIPSLGLGAGLSISPTQIAAEVSWVDVMRQGGAFMAIAITSLVSILLNCSALEAESTSEIDFNRELRATGVANLLAGSVGGMPGFSSLSLSRLAADSGARSRLAGVVVAVVSAAVLLIHPGVVGFLPRFLLGGLLFYLGLRFLNEWIFQAFARLPRSDFAMILLILVVIGVFGYLQGVMVGLLTATVLFVVNYSRVQVVTHALTGLEHRSNVDRPLAHQRLLAERGDELEIFKLQGFLFFGSANNLLSQIRARLSRLDLKRLRFVLLDFRRVHGIDSSAVLAMQKLRRHAESDDFTLIFCNIDGEVAANLARAGFSMNPGAHFRLAPDRDHALEWCENRLLDAALAEQAPDARLVDALALNGDTPFPRMLSYMERREVQTGDVVIEEGAPSSELFWIESGRVTAVLGQQDGSRIRLRSMTAGSVLGELGVFLEEPRTASVVADEPCILYCLSLESMERMVRERPDLHEAFQRFALRMLSERLVRTNRALQSVLE